MIAGVAFGGCIGAGSGWYPLCWTFDISEPVGMCRTFGPVGWLFVVSAGLDSGGRARLLGPAGVGMCDPGAVCVMC